MNMKELVVIGKTIDRVLGKHRTGPGFQLDGQPILASYQDVVSAIRNILGKSWDDDDTGVSIEFQHLTKGNRSADSLTFMDRLIISDYASNSYWAVCTYVGFVDERPTVSIAIQRVDPITYKPIQ